MGRLFAISDVHGYGHLLLRLLEHVRYDGRRDQLFLLGDYVNKGPDSIGTLRLIRELCLNGAVALQGNNERKWLRGDPAYPIPDEPDTNELLQFIKGLRVWCEYPPYLFVHAGIRPGIPLSEQSIEDLTEIRDDFHHSEPIQDRIVVFGHTSTERLGAMSGCVWLGDGKLGIDTGAGHGHRLTLIELKHRRYHSIEVSFPDFVQDGCF